MLIIDDDDDEDLTLKIEELKKKKYLLKLEFYKIFIRIYIKFQKLNMWNQVC